MKLFDDFSRLGVANWVSEMLRLIVLLVFFEKWRKYGLPVATDVRGKGKRPIVVTVAGHCLGRGRNFRRSQK